MVTAMFFKLVQFKCYEGKNKLPKKRNISEFANFIICFKLTAYTFPISGKHTQIQCLIIQIYYL
jgi:hypothetical protein